MRVTLKVKLILNSENDAQYKNGLHWCQKCMALEGEYVKKERKKDIPMKFHHSIFVSLWPHLV